MKNFINHLPDKENTIIGENAAFISGGQRQRIAIARAIYFDPEILILDEATSEVDGPTEAKIFQSIMEEYNDKTVVVVSHNKTNMRYCEKYFNIENRKLIKI